MNITMLPINKLHYHPNNPRTDLGDVTEIADSMKVMGVLQNLVVVPYTSTDFPTITIENGDGSDDFVIVAGHRRKKAGHQANLTELPCMISNMSLSEQISTMLIENLQRNSLTTYQESKAIQMMLDLGNTVESIAEKTGFSKSMVEKRAKLAVFDPAAFAATEARNETIPMDHYLKAAKLEDAEERNKLLASVGTKDFDWELKAAKTRIKSKSLRIEQMKLLASFAKPVAAKEADFAFIRGIYSSTEVKDIKVPEDAKTREYFYVEEKSGSISLYRRKSADEISSDEEQKKFAADQDANNTQLKEAAKRSFELRVEFVEKLTAAFIKKRFAAIAPHLAAYLRGQSLNGYELYAFDHDLASKLLGVTMSEENPKVICEADLKEVARKYPERTMLVLCYLQLEDKKLSYVRQEWKKAVYCTVHKEEPKLDRIYDLLSAIGYQMAEEEQQMHDGTHPLFYKEPEKVSNKAPVEDEATVEAEAPAKAVEGTETKVLAEAAANAKADPTAEPTANTDMETSDFSDAA